MKELIVISVILNSNGIAVFLVLAGLLTLFYVIGRNEKRDKRKSGK
jgi:hypothetical protein